MFHQLLAGVIVCVIVSFSYRLLQENPEVAMDSIVHITQHMTQSQRSEVTRILASMDASQSS